MLSEISPSEVGTVAACASRPATNAAATAPLVICSNPVFAISGPRECAMSFQFTASGVAVSSEVCLLDFLVSSRSLVSFPSSSRFSVLRSSFSFSRRVRSRFISAASFADSDSASDCLPILSSFPVKVDGSKLVASNRFSISAFCRRNVATSFSSMSNCLVVAE